MKSIKIGLTVFLVAASLLFGLSCKKDPVSSPTTQEKISGKWKMQTIVENNFYSGVPHIITYTGNATDYADFSKDGKVEISMYGNVDTSPYGIISESKIWIDDVNDIYDVQTLTNTALKLSQKETFPGGEYYETTYTFSR